jgi:hypothetical protein
MPQIQFYTVGLGLAGGTHYGSWVDLSAPGTNILSTTPSGMDCERCETTGLYEKLSGTSQATPAVTGALALVLKRHPEWISDSKLALQRLQNTAAPTEPHPVLGSLDIGKGRIDVFEAVFNGDFELVKKGTNEPEEWEQSIGSARACTSNTDYLGETPNHGERMLVCTNADVVISGEMNALDIPEGVTELPISFDWKIVSEDLQPTGKSGSRVETCEYEIDHTIQPPRSRLVCRERFKLHNDFVLVQLVALDNGSKRTEVHRSV